MFKRLSAPLHNHPRLTVACGLVGTVLLFYLPLLLGVRTFPDGDFVHHFLPFSLFQARAIAETRLPLWNPYTYGGHPFLADTQAAVFYPVSNLLLLMTLPWQGDAFRLYALQFDAVVHTILGGWFVYLLVHEIIDSRWSALLAGLTFALSGYLVGYPPLQLAILRAGVWLPLILWLLLRTARSSSPWAWAAGAGIVLACAFLAGHPQTFLYIAWVTFAWMILLVALVWRDRGTRSGWRMAGACLLTVVAAAGVSAAQLLPSIEFTLLSVRAIVSYAFVSEGFPLRDTWQALLPGVFTQYSPIYVGVPALFLTAVALAGLRRHWLRPGISRPWRAAATIFLAGVALFGLLVSHGDNGILYPLVYRLMPGWSLFRGQERAAYLVALGLSGCAGIGASLVTAIHPLVRRRIALVCGALILAAVYGFGLLFQLNGDTVLSNAHYLRTALLTLIAASAVALAFWLPGWSDARSALMLALTALCLFAASYGINFATRSPAQAMIVAPEVAALKAATDERGGANLGLDARVYNEFRAYEDYAMRARLEDLWGSSPLRLARYASLAKEFPLDRWWRLFGVDHVLTWRRNLFEPSTLLAEFPQTTDSTFLHRLDEANPRAWVVGAVRVAEDEEARALLADHEFDLETTAILPPETGAPPSEASSPAAEIRLQRPAPERLIVDATLDSPGLLLIAENWMPGWHVEQTAESSKTATAPILGLIPFSVHRADLTLMAVPLPAGESTFALVYAPESVRTGLWISAAFLLVLVGLFCAPHWRSRRP